MRGRTLAPWQDFQMICLNGHQITDSVQEYETALPKLCPRCGAENITACPKCKTQIPGHKYYPGVFVASFEARPDHCGECGEAFPWKNNNATSKLNLKDKAEHQLSTKVFIVHGHDEGMKEAVARTLTTLGQTPIILHEMPNGGKTVIEKFEAYSDVGFAVVLLSPDDKAFLASEDHKEATPTFRARQNVIFELGFFVAKLGRSRVLVLRKANVEILSDYSGVIYEVYDNSSGNWRFTLVKELHEVGYTVSADSLIKQK